MKENFLTIPDAPNYEINSKLTVRNKTTGKILKPYKRGADLRIKLNNGGEIINRSLKTLRAQAAAAVSDLQWESVPSLGYKYELTKGGRLRNAKTKRVLKMWDGIYLVYVDGVKKGVTVKSLLWEVYGFVCEPQNNSPVACTATKDGVTVKFKSKHKLAKWLSLNCHYSPSRIRTLLVKRNEEVFGWKIKYNV